MYAKNLHIANDWIILHELFCFITYLFPRMNSQQKQVVVGIIITLVLVFGARWAYFAYQDSLRDPNIKYLESLPQFKKANFDVSICMDLANTDGKTSYIDCFIPKDVSKHIASMEDPKAFLAALKDAKPMAVAAVAQNKKDPILQFVDSLQPSPVSLTGQYLSIRANLLTKIGNNPSMQDLQDYLYLLSVEGDSAKMKDVQAAICKKGPRLCTEDKQITLSFSGKVLTNK